MPTPPQSEAEFESYQDLYRMEIPQKFPGKYDDGGAYTLRRKMAEDVPGWPHHDGSGTASAE